MNWKIPNVKFTLATLLKTGMGAFSFLVISSVTSVSLACLAVLGATAFLAWKAGNWDAIAILALSALAVVSILVGTFIVLHRLNAGSGEPKGEEGSREEGTHSA